MFNFFNILWLDNVNSNWNHSLCLSLYFLKFLRVGFQCCDTGFLWFFFTPWPVSGLGVWVSGDRALRFFVRQDVLEAAQQRQALGPGFFLKLGMFINVYVMRRRALHTPIITCLEEHNGIVLVQCNDFLSQYVSLVRYNQIKFTHVRGFVFISKTQGGIHIFWQGPRYFFRINLFLLKWVWPQRCSQRTESTKICDNFFPNKCSFLRGFQIVRSAEVVSMIFANANFTSPSKTPR